MLLGFPLNTFAYSSEVYLGGNTIGINIKTPGVMVIGFYKVNGKYPKTKIVEGDIITKVANTKISSIKDLTTAIENNIKDNKVDITYLRNNKEKTTTLELINDNNVLKTGLYVKDSITGIGTLTLIDPEDNTYGALGHEIVETNTSKIIEVESGNILENSITGIVSSTDGVPGSKKAKFNYNNIYGNITKNTKYGIYGNYNIEYDKSNLISIADPKEVEIGPAYIYTVLSDNSINSYKIEITNINENSDIKNITFQITDKKLLEEAGGIVQGMSGSPIVQNGKLIGAVTHVITDDVKSGYGVFITTMLEESDK